MALLPKIRGHFTFIGMKLRVKAPSMSSNALVWVKCAGCINWRCIWSVLYN